MLFLMWEVLWETVFVRPWANDTERQVYQSNVLEFKLRSIEFARYEKHGNKCSLSFPSDLRKIFTLRKHSLMLLKMKRRFLFMQYPNVLVRSKTYLSNKLNLPTHIDSCSVSDGLRNPESSKRKITYFLDVSSQISTYSDFCSFAVFFPLLQPVTFKSFFLYC